MNFVIYKNVFKLVWRKAIVKLAEKQRIGKGCFQILSKMDIKMRSTQERDNKARHVLCNTFTEKKLKLRWARRQEIGFGLRYCYENCWKPRDIMDLQITAMTEMIYKNDLRK